jgi:L-seryl-tRNA(Ser) seleniumtransferase
VGRLPLAALEATLALYRDPARALREIPVLAMLDTPPEVLARRAEALAAATGGGIVASVARVGGGALPLVELQGPAVALPGEPEALARRLRQGDPPVVGRIADGRLLLDPRTLTDDDIPVVTAAVHAALEHGR